MKKRLVLKKWVEIVLAIIATIMFMIMGSECDNMLLFVTSHIGAGIIFLLIGIVLVKYGRD